MPERSDALKRSLKRYLDSGLALSASLAKMSRADLEHALRELTQHDSEARERVEDVIEELRVRSRRSAEQVVDLVRNEAQREFEVVIAQRREDLADLADRIARLASSVIGQATATSDSSTTSGPAASTKKASGKSASRASGKKSASPKASGSKASGSKASSSKASSSKASSSKASGASAKKVSSLRKAPAKRPTN